ncbi:MAG: hypothetical protein QOH47_1560 [Sphingomonadales bacterium]|nr:hypothetical protein [Sphingomonadales bacterium]
MGISVSFGRRLRAAALAFTLACAPLLAACAANSHAGISPAPGGAGPDLQALTRQAQAGDKQAQLELGIRYEEGRGVERDPARAERLYLTSLAGPRFQTQYVPANGAVVAENTAIGSGQRIWPASFAEIRSYHPSRIAALLRLCGLASRSHDAQGCSPPKPALLRQLAQLETSFRACRVRSNYGNAGPGPYSYIFNAVDEGRLRETRRCMFDETPPNAIPRDQSQLIWTMWLALDRFDRCARISACDVREIRSQFTAAIATYREDSLMWFAMRDALRQQPVREIQVGGSWWWSLCGLASPGEPLIAATEAETKICALTRALTDNGMR